MNQKKLLSPDSFSINAQELTEQLVSFIQSNFDKSFRDGIVVPISGGLDSSVVASLCVRAIGKEKILGLMLPENLGNPEANIYGKQIADHLGIKTKTVNISPVLRALGTSNLFLSFISGREKWKKPIALYLQKRKQSAKLMYMQALTGKLDPTNRSFIASVSSKQRARLLLTYKIAEEQNLMVVGSSHKTEQIIGLFVKYGIDDCADLMPLKSLYRSHILQIANCLAIPQAILKRSPNPDILPGITDKYIGYFGIDYQKIDLILMGLEMNLDLNEIASQLSLELETVQQIQSCVKLSEPSRTHELSLPFKTFINDIL